MSIREGYRWLQKPFLGVGLDRTHPLAAGLVSYWVLNEGGGPTVRDAANPRSSGTLSGTTGTPAWAAGTTGFALTFTAANAQYAALNQAVPLTDGYNWSLTWEVNLVGATDQAILGYSGDTDDYIYHRLNTGSPYVAMVDSGYADQSISCTLARQQGLHRWTLTRSGSASAATMTLYRDGVSLGTNSAVTGFAWSKPNRLGYGGGLFLNSPLGLVILHSAALTAGAVAQLHADPYGVFLAPTTRRFFAPAGGAGVVFPWSNDPGQVLRPPTILLPY
jgi:hypothetical protein